MISQNSVLTNYAFTENLSLRKLKAIMIKLSAVVLLIVKVTISYFELCIAIY